MHDPAIPDHRKTNGIESGLGLLKTAAAQRQDQGVAEGGAGWIGWLDRCALVDHTLVVQDQNAPRLGEGEAQTLRAADVEHARLAAADVVACHQDDGHQIYAVAVRALGGGASDAAGRVNAELVRFGIKGRVAPQITGDPGQAGEQGGPGRILRQHRGQRREPPLDSAVQCVVVDRLPVRAMRHAPDMLRLEHEAAVTPPAVAAAVAQVLVRRQVVPQRRPARERVGRHTGQPGERGGIQHGKAGARKLCAQIVERDERRRGADRHDGAWSAQRGGPVHFSVATGRGVHASVWVSDTRCGWTPQSLAKATWAIPRRFRISATAAATWEPTLLTSQLGRERLPSDGRPLP